MKKVPFRVSARAARLIGRENIATSQGAITELVKNAYDADATACGIFFLKRYDQPPKSITPFEFIEFSKISDIAATLYSKTESGYSLQNKISESDQLQLAIIIDELVDLWIVDNGRGMSAEVIEERWMVIGTDSKENVAKSSGGRILTGAKGIGRFALDRLGQECELYSSPKESVETIHWWVDWGDFEGTGKIIDDVTAILESEDRSFIDVLKDAQLNQILPNSRPIDSNDQTPLVFQNGTAIKIRVLHDVWDKRDSLKLKEILEALLPPRDQGDFGIYVYDHRNLEESGWIENFPPDQFDFRLQANVKSDGTVAITIDRQEIDVSKIRESVFTLPAMSKPGYTLSDFKNGSRSYVTAINDIVALEDWEGESDLRSIGALDFTLYFFKLANPTSDNLERFPQKSFDVSKRRRWLGSSGGIRLYRDEFRVRPYGEPNTQGSDWLLLGQRVAQNPAAVSRLSWRVPPQQVAGTIHISKEINPLLADQSNREGIMNKRAFSLFRRIILALIGEFERDRSYIYHHFNKAYNQDHPESGKLERGKKIAAKVLADDKIQQTDKCEKTTENGSKSENNDGDSALPLAEALRISQQKNVVLKDDIQVLRGMATLGTVLVSSAHELKQIKANMGSRQQRMQNALDRVVDLVKIKDLPEPVNPYDILRRWGREDEKVSRWVDFVLESVSPKKRRRGPISWETYLKNLKVYWNEFLSERIITLAIPSALSDDPHVLAYEIDLDSIFYNLIINSYEAFSLPSLTSSREIKILWNGVVDDVVSFEYHDNGPGISESFNVADDIFIYGITSKREAKNNDVSGTGIGLWLVKSIFDDYGGDVEILSNMGNPGFSLRLSLPLYRKSQNT